MLIIFSGLPGTGKSTVASELAQRIGATWLRIDSIEQAMTDPSRNMRPVADEGYKVGYAVAEDNLRLGRTVIADSVNPIEITRRAWRDVADKAGTQSIEVEFICSDRSQHRNQVENREVKVSGLKLPSWQEVLDRNYEPWDRDHIVIDTSGKSVEQSVEELLREFAALESDASS